MATFKKPLVAYVNGLVNGLGARILPLFDVVWANDDATFNVKGGLGSGEIVEGTAVISVTDKIHYNAVSSKFDSRLNCLPCIRKSLTVCIRLI